MNQTIDLSGAVATSGPGATRDLLHAYDAVRARTEAYAAPLSPEDQTVQSMDDASPVKWHRAHTTWFFEQFVLRAHDPDYEAFDPDFDYLFNSYYDTVGARHPRVARGLVTRPDAGHVGAYRAHVDRAMRALIEAGRVPADLLELGFAHEEQHQELLLTDMHHAFSRNVLAWARRDIAVSPGFVDPYDRDLARRPVGWLEHRGGVVAIGRPDHDAAFGFDNEGPRHAATLAPHALADRLVRNREWAAFVADGGYRRPLLWMSDGWAECVARGWSGPLYWRGEGADAVEFGLGGAAALDPDAPVRHVSWYEADAYARWADARLPTEFELEASADLLPEFDTLAWQWTNSAYLPYPGFRPGGGAIGEYNGKFMINQMVLRGGSAATSPGHSRATYRNFFPPGKRWQMTGLRLARDL